MNQRINRCLATNGRKRALHTLAAIGGLMLSAAAAAEVIPTFDAAGPAPHQRQAQQYFHDAMDARLSAFMPQPEERVRLLERVYREAKLAGLPPGLVLALIEVESAFKSRAISSAGAVGLMQIMPFWINELGLAADDLKDPSRNLRYGCTILAHYLRRENGDFTRALARYNGSLGKTWYPERVMSAWQGRWRPTP